MNFSTNRDFTVLNLSMPMRIMRFYLVYRGPLPSTQRKRSGRREERIAVRKQIAPQMANLWATNKNLISLQWDAQVPGRDVHTWGIGYSPLHEHREAPPTPDRKMQNGFVDLSEPIVKHGKSFRPLVRRSLDLTCSLSVLFLRQGDPGLVINQQGDIDNRVKTFIDALEMPQDELEGDESEGVNLPLLESDSLVRGLEIDTERLLLPDSPFPNEVHLVVEVTVHVERVGPWNIMLL